MAYDPKIRIEKVVTRQDRHGNDFNRFENVHPKVLRLDDMKEIKTERDLLLFIYNNWGPGVYHIIGYAKGREGFWSFWKGEITNGGWIFFQQQYNRKEVKEWEKMLEGNEDDPEMQRIVEEEKEEAKRKRKSKRYGFDPFLKRSGRRGEWHRWEDEKLEKEMDGNMKETAKEDWNIKNKKNNEDHGWKNMEKNKENKEKDGWGGIL